MKLLHISFAIAILGILTILIITNILQPKLTAIDQLSTKQLNKQVKIQGIITNIKTHPNFQTITIQDSTKSIQAILNPPSKNIAKNQKIIITGTLQQYKNKLQIQINKILANPSP